MKILWTHEDLSLALHQDIKIEASGISIDSRTLNPGDLYIAIQGPKFDGHQFVQEALEKGAAGVVYSKNSCDIPQEKRIFVQDTYQALQDLGGYRRTQVTCPIVGITGSYGKTITKEMLRLCLDSSAYVSPKSFNNHYGVPLSLANMPKDASVGVFELGMNHQGEIGSLAKMVRPTIAAITTIGEAHLENFTNLEAIAQTKSEIFQYLEGPKTIILNRDTQCFETLFKNSKGIGEIVLFGVHIDSNVRLLALSEFKHHQKVSIAVDEKLFQYNLFSVGKGDRIDSLCAIAILKVLRYQVSENGKGIEKYHPLEGRGNHHEIETSRGEIIVIDETYNAAPENMQDALKNLGSWVESGRRIAVLGDMLELGDQSEQYHKNLALYMDLYNIDQVFTCGSKMLGLYNALPKSRRGGHHTDVNALAKLVAEEVTGGDVVLVKGSKKVRMPKGWMHHVVDELVKLGR